MREGGRGGERGKVGVRFLEFKADLASKYSLVGGRGH